MPNEKAVEVRGITKRYGQNAAVNDVSFDVAEGEIFGFLGPNGAGKTTLIRILTTLVPPTEGSARVACCDVSKEPEKVRQAIGVVPQAMTSDLDLTGFENMDIYGRFYGISSKERRERIKELLEMVGLTSRAKDLVAAYSGGMRRRLEIARVLVHQPRILFLDEPTIGLDPQSRRVVWDFLRRLIEKASMTVFLTTHYMEEAEALCSRVAIIDSGKIIVMGSPDELKAQIPGNDIISLSLEDLTETVIDRIKALTFVHRIAVEDRSIRVYVDNGALNLPALIDEARSSGGKILSASIHEQSLEDVFIHYTGKSIREEDVKKVNFLIGAGIPQRWGR
ncbi:MAG TPA: ATP-binding cassette domain-containing protein [Thermodesulfovibrionales bacterium]|nr:ATP-binding cassette domain-containing protein [Thermodesulfovibrionales bacterium]